MQCLQVDGEGHRQQVERHGAAQVTPHGAVHIGHDGVADGVLVQQVAVGKGRDDRRRFGIKLFVAFEQFQAQRREHLQIELLTQDRILGAGGFVAAEFGHQGVGRRNASRLQRLGEARQYEFLNDVQQDVVAGELEAVAETLLGNDVHVAARSRATRAVQAVVP
ncbi:hypothetical protein G6F31_017884 [Rhizopus arrhizus]|nr:hypothetical protein G6F31_017884 [Rhizopus arrhizus]